jgi:hypothetical protein
MNLHVLILERLYVDVRSFRYLICFSVARLAETVVEMSLSMSISLQQYKHINISSSLYFLIVPKFHTQNFLMFLANGL